MPEEPTPEQPTDTNTVPNDAKDLANTDWNAIYGTTPEDQSKYPVQDLGITDEAMAEYQKNLQDEFNTGNGGLQGVPTEDGGRKYTYDDGSTLTVDADGNIVDYTEAEQGMLLSDLKGQTGTGSNAGAIVTPKPTPTPKPTVTTNTTTTNVTPATTQTGGTNWASLLSTLAAMSAGQQQQQQAATPPPTVDIGPQFDLEQPLETNPFYRATTNQASTTKMAAGGSIDDLLALLKRG